MSDPIRTEPRIVRVRTSVARDGAVEVSAGTDLEPGEYDAVIVLIARPADAPSFEESLDAYLARARRVYVQAAVEHVGGSRAAAARLLKVTERTVYRALATRDRGDAR